MCRQIKRNFSSKRQSVFSIITSFTNLIMVISFQSQFVYIWCKFLLNAKINPILKSIYLKTPLDGFFWLHILWMKNTARNKQIVFFAESGKTVKLKLFLEKAKKGHSGKFLHILKYILRPSISTTSWQITPCSNLNNSTDGYETAPMNYERWGIYKFTPGKRIKKLCPNDQGNILIYQYS